ncbi:hypothetical protein FRC03_011985 [Tulasnella sp. 419]|nr:hypothetical protein FRC03_011985 [Tulasnella sp. 419]
MSPPPPDSSSLAEKSSARDIFENTLSGAQDRPFIPTLKQDRLRYGTEIIPHTLREYRLQEGKEHREKRLRSIWSKLPKGRNSIRSAKTGESSKPVDYSKLTKERAESLKKMYQDELFDHGSEDFNSFVSYADRKEAELWSVFHDQLDLDGNGHLDEMELYYALNKAGIQLSSAQLSEFLSYLASSQHSQAISFTEFRDFLLLLPRRTSPEEMYRYYQVRLFLGDDGHGVARVNMEGDVSLSAEDRHPPPKIHHHEEEYNDARDQVSTHHDEDDEDEDDEDPHASFFEMVGHSQAVKFLLAGGIAGAVSRTATAPFDRLKVFLITRETNPLPTGLSTSGPEAAKQTMRGVRALGAAISQLYIEGGLKAFWVGNGLNVIKIFPESAIKFLSYESCKRLLAKHWDRVEDQRNISGSSRFISGGVGGIISQFAIYPLETLKTQMMSSSKGAKNSMREAAIRTWKLGGVQAYYRGLAIGLLGVFPYSAIDMSTFESLKLIYIKSSGVQEPGVLALLAFGSISGTVGATSVYPLNLVRTRLQASGSPGHPQRYTGLGDVVKQTYMRDGWSGFYRGLVPTLAKVVPAVSISYVVYENSKRRLGV